MATSTQPNVSTNGSPPDSWRPTLRLATGKIESIRKGEILSELTEEQWQQWTTHVAKRKPSASLAKLTGAKSVEFLTWGLSDTDATAETRELIASLGLQRKKLSADQRATASAAIESWLAEHGGGDVSPRLDWYFGLECLALAYACSRFSPQLDRTLCSYLLSVLTVVAKDGVGIDRQLNPLTQQILGGELSLTLAYLFPELEVCRSLAKTARRTLCRGVNDLIDGGGELEGLHLQVGRGLLACWTRSDVVGKALKRATFDKDASVLLRWFVHHFIAICRPDGGQMLAASGGTEDRELLPTAAEQFGDFAEKKLAKYVLASKSGAKLPRGLKQLAEPATHSDWACTALLRSSWRHDSPRLYVEYSSDEINTELCVDDRVIWSGACPPTIRVDDKMLRVDSPWSEVCWNSDEDADYIELEALLQDGWKCQRQFLLDRTDRFLYVADAILGPEEKEIEYSCDWPLSGKIKACGESETTEHVLKSGKKKVARVLPLALPEWKCDGRRNGALQVSEAGMSYRLQAKAQRLYAPLAFDLDTERLKYPFTWRQLSVGRGLEYVLPSEAVGYRVQFRLDQWLIYRSLAPVDSRTLLGQNYYYEFVCGRFERCGEVEPLIEVE